ncbi:hypothetical protein cyc_07629 [Cyclospora cayetanensis]|uniref:Uncharacterized protein n=1 Tax=Cyclospora cayetanensis TaxID=88456 RepID=A0A1D3DAC9_9EIME|nr:hypothetical protein cyc_07629 [Cyclospora cayetanensis]
MSQGCSVLEGKVAVAMKPDIAANSSVSSSPQLRPEGSSTSPSCPSESLPSKAPPSAHTGSSGRRWKHLLRVVEVREFSPYGSLISPRRADTDLGWVGGGVGRESSLEDPLEAPGSDLCLGFASGELSHPHRGLFSSSAEEDVDGVPRFLRRDVAAALAATAATDGGEATAGNGGVTALPAGLTLDQAITFGHGKFASRSLSSPRNSGSGAQAMQDFLKATDSDPGAAKAAEEVVTGWCA